MQLVCQFMVNRQGFFIDFRLFYPLKTVKRKKDPKLTRKNARFTFKLKTFKNPINLKHHGWGSNDVTLDLVLANYQKTKEIPAALFFNLVLFQILSYIDSRTTFIKMQYKTKHIL